MSDIFVPNYSLGTCIYCASKNSRSPDELLRCGKCRRLAHSTCLRSGVPPGQLEGDNFYEFTCQPCAKVGTDIVFRASLSVTQLLLLAMYNLHMKTPAGHRKGFFHWKLHIYKFISQHWNDLFQGEGLRRKKRSLQGTVSAHLSHYPHFFAGGHDVLNDGGWYKLCQVLPPAVLLHQEAQKKKKDRNTNPGGPTNKKAKFEEGNATDKFPIEGVYVKEEVAEVPLDESSCGSWYLERDILKPQASLPNSIFEDDYEQEEIKVKEEIKVEEEYFEDSTEDIDVGQTDVIDSDLPPPPLKESLFTQNTPSVSNAKEEQEEEEDSTRKKDTSEVFGRMLCTKGVTDELEMLMNETCELLGDVKSDAHSESEVISGSGGLACLRERRSGDVANHHPTPGPSHAPSLGLASHLGDNRRATEDLCVSEAASTSHYDALPDVPSGNIVIGMNIPTERTPQKEAYECKKLYIDAEIALTATATATATGPSRTKRKLGIATAAATAAGPSRTKRKLGIATVTAAEPLRKKGKLGIAATSTSIHKRKRIHIESDEDISDVDDPGYLPSPLDTESALTAIAAGPSRKKGKLGIAAASAPIPKRKHIHIESDEDISISDIDDSEYMPSPLNSSDSDRFQPLLVGGSSQSSTADDTSQPSPGTPPSPVTQPSPAFPPSAAAASASATPSVHDLIHQISLADRRAPDKTLWSCTPLSRVLPSQPPLPYIPGANASAKQARTPGEFFYLFFDDAIITEIALWTNQMIDKLASNYKYKSAPTNRTCNEEIRALLGILITSGSVHDNQVTVEEMWNVKHGAPMYRATMNERRFDFLIRCLRFDDRTTRAERIQTDRLAPVRKIWDMLVENCKKHYTPGDKVTVDEQFLGIRGHCPFQMYIRNKPAKYGLKIMMACDASSFYMLNAIPYLGKQSLESIRAGTLGQHYSMALMGPYLNCGRTLTIANWFTSLPLANELFKENTTLVGTIRRKRYLPKVIFEHDKTRPVKTSSFLYQQNVMLVSYKPEQNKNVQLLSTHHQTGEIGSNRKPEIVEYYNKTKVGVDIFNMMCAKYTTSRRTRRWPLCLFYGMTNIAVLNSFILYKKCVSVQRTDSIRRLYMKDLGLELAKPWALKRLEVPTLNLCAVRLIREVFGGLAVGLSLADHGTATKKKKKCKFCPWRNPRKIRSVCHKCGRHACDSHYKIFCLECSE